MRSQQPRRGRSRKELWPDTDQATRAVKWSGGRRMGMAARQSTGRCKQSVSAQYIIWKQGHGSLEEPWEGSEWVLVAFLPKHHTHAHTLTCTHACTHKHTRAPLRRCLRAMLVHNKHTLWPLLEYMISSTLRWPGKLSLIFKQFKHHHLETFSQSHFHIPSTLTQTSLHTLLCVPYNWHILYPGALPAAWLLSVSPKKTGSC